MIPYLALTLIVSCLYFPYWLIWQEGTKLQQFIGRIVIWPVYFAYKLITI